MYVKIWICREIVWQNRNRSHEVNVQDNAEEEPESPYHTQRKATSTNMGKTKPKMRVQTEKDNQMTIYYTTGEGFTPFQAI
jgi:hypothetical protein